MADELKNQADKAAEIGIAIGRRKASAMAAKL
jgi:hypothetical protein